MQNQINKYLDQIQETKLENINILYNIMTIIIDKNKINFSSLNILQLKWKL